MSWLDRLKQEKTELEERLTALNKALESPHESISLEQLALLEQQSEAMQTYLDILVKRLSLIESIEYLL
jgi:predicted  nucleic acid-binding Zn-ribbon protein